MGFAAVETDDVILDRVPDFLAIGTMMKATPVSDGGERLLYIEASNEDVDHQGEIVLQKALAESADYYRRHGNIDISHYSLMGLKAGIPNHLEYEIGKPLDVRVSGGSTFVKAQLYQGDSAMARNADMVWESLTKQKPPASWFASVGGAVLAKSIKHDADSGQRVAVIERVRWSNVALDRCPVNKTVPEVSTAPFGVFAKSLGGFVMAKVLTAGYGTDSATLTGGGALRTQSLDHTPQSYWDFRDKLAGDIRAKKVKPRASSLVAHATAHYGLNQADAAEWTERFMRDLASLTHAKIKGQHQ